MFACKQFLGLSLFLALSAAFLAPHPAAAQVGRDDPVTSLSRVREAVVHIVAVGAAWSYGEPERSVEVGAGSGFIVDPEGIVVTNAHVANGGNLFEVYLYGESAPRNAVLLGVSECDDLAVLDIRGSGFPYLLWKRTPVLDSEVVYAAGYPNGDYSETKGRVQDAESGGDSDWASVDQVVRHTAELHPGNSGGPLLDRSGRVSGINFAGNDEDHSYFAISKDLAIPLVKQLAEGQDVDSIGINGLAFADSDDRFGIWAVAVKSGSPADRAGLQPGDIIYRMEDIDLARDGTMRDYCDIIRSHRPGDTIAFDALRGNESIAGQINGRPIAAEGQVNPEAESQETGDTGAAAAPGSGERTVAADRTTEEDFPPPGYQLVQDDTGVIKLFVPDHWTEGFSKKTVLGSAVYGPNYVIVENSADKSIYSAGAIGVSVSSVGKKSYDDELDLMRIADACQFTKRVDVQTEDLTGRADLWHTCDGNAGWTAVTAVLHPISDDMTTVRVTVTRLERVSSLETVIAPLGKSLRQQPVYWDFPSAIIKADILNVRSGPNTDYDKRGQLELGDWVTVLGKDTEECQWYYILGDEVAGWISAAGEHSTLDRDCQELKVVTEEELQEPSFE
jgi:serine protease Do